MIYAKYLNTMNIIEKEYYLWIERYKKWLKLRDNSLEDGEKLCYCGHTRMCTCGNPDIETFRESVLQGTIKENDPNNGWKTIPK